MLFGVKKSSTPSLAINNDRSLNQDFFKKFFLKKFTSGNVINRKKVLLIACYHESPLKKRLG